MVYSFIIPIISFVFLWSSFFKYMGRCQTEAGGKQAAIQHTCISFSAMFINYQITWKMQWLDHDCSNPHASGMVHRCSDSNGGMNFSLLFQRDAQSLNPLEEEEWQ